MNFLFNLRVERTFNTYGLVADVIGEDSLAFLLEGATKERATRAFRTVSAMIETSTRSQIEETLLRA